MTMRSNSSSWSSILAATAAMIVVVVISQISVPTFAFSLVGTRHQTSVGGTHRHYDSSQRLQKTRISWQNAVLHGESSNDSSSLSSTVMKKSAADGRKGVSNFGHTLAILTFPRTAIDRITNELILEEAMSHTSNTLSVVLRCRDNLPHRTPLSDLCSFVGEVYSVAWDAACEKASTTTTNDDSTKEEEEELDILNVVVYPQSLPNAAPEQWLYQRKDLECVCGVDDLLGWHSTGSGEDAANFLTSDGDGMGGLSSHVDAINADRMERGLEKVEAMKVEIPEWLNPHEDVLYLEDDHGMGSHPLQDGQDLLEEDSSLGILGGARLDDKSLFSNVAVGGTFDGLHYGHRKLLTLAVSSVEPQTGRLLIGITCDKMLTKKTLSNLIPSYTQRKNDVLAFVDALAPGLKNRRRVVEIQDAFGPPGCEEDFDALVLSHETLRNGHLLNVERERLGFKKLKLLCTRRTEPNGMSSTQLRRMRDAKHRQHVKGDD